MRLLKDIWITIRYILPQAWRTQRDISRMEKHISKLEKKNGVCNTFLMFFESSIEHGVGREELEYMLQTFIDCADENILAEKEWDDILSYADNYLS
tara:strand:+ start:58 stop:345 length:288 start_codon:yes stop_codon:yes gene_type:complete